MKTEQVIEHLRLQIEKDADMLMQGMEREGKAQRELNDAKKVIEQLQEQLDDALNPKKKKKGK